MIEFLDGAAFSGPLRPPKSRGISPIFRGKIKINDEKLRCYIKPLPDIIHCPVTGLNVSNREIISEALGYVLAKSAGLNVPDVAGVILLDTEQLPKDMLTAWKLCANGSLWSSKRRKHGNASTRRRKAAISGETTSTWWNARTPQ